MKKRMAIVLAVSIVLALAVPALAAYDLPQTERIVYGYSGEGRELVAYRYGNGKNVLVMGFAIHGYEDNFARDGECLVYTGEKLMEHLKTSQLPDAHNWTVYVLPCMNPDGLNSGWTNNGPGRCTTTYLDSSGKLIKGKGIDMNRCFPTSYRSLTNARNFNGTQPMACLEAKALSAFLQKVKGSGDNLLIDVHGWTQQIITTSARIKNVARTHFPNNSVSYSNGGVGYLMNYARTLGYESCLLELPYGYYSKAQYVSGNCTSKVISVVDDLLRSEPLTCGANGHQYQAKDTPATCTQSGVHKEVCSICGKTNQTTTAPLGHSPDPVSVKMIQMPTACRPGLRSFDCTRCGKSDLSQTIPSIFTDVQAEGFYSDALDLCYARGYIKGWTQTTFEPELPLSRGMLVTILHRFLGEEEPTSVAPFTDLDKNEYYVTAVNWAYSTGVIRGATATTFEPDEMVTRQQAMTIFHRLAVYLNADNGKRSPGNFPDQAQLESYAVEAAQWSAANGIIIGDELGRLNPRDNTTRAESVTILVRVAEYLDAAA